MSQSAFQTKNKYSSAESLDKMSFGYIGARLLLAVSAGDRHGKTRSCIELIRLFASDSSWELDTVFDFDFKSRSCIKNLKITFSSMLLTELDKQAEWLVIFRRKEYKIAICTEGDAWIDMLIDFYSKVFADSSVVVVVAACHSVLRSKSGVLAHLYALAPKMGFSFLMTAPYYILSPQVPWVKAPRPLPTNVQEWNVLYAAQQKDTIESFLRVKHP